MKIRFGEIPAEGLRIEISDESWFPDHELHRTGPVWSKILLKRDGDDRVLLTGEIRTTVELDCDRCAENFEMPLAGNFKLDLEYSPEKSIDYAEHECSTSEMDMIYLQAPVIDVFELLVQQVYLMVPDKVLCEEACKGLCPRCGVNLNQGGCDCKNELRDSPFAILKR